MEWFGRKSEPKSIEPNEDYVPGPAWMKEFERKKAGSKIKSKSLIEEADKLSLNKQDMLYSSVFVGETYRNGKLMTPEMRKDLDRVQSASFDEGFAAALKIGNHLHRALLMEVPYGT